jgi:hypothetical protein
MLLVQQTNHLPFGNDKDPAAVIAVGGRPGGYAVTRLAMPGASRKASALNARCVFGGMSLHIIGRIGAADEKA